MPLHESGEDYLEAILVLHEQKGNVRSIDVAQHLGYSKPSVSRAMSILRSSGYITMERDGRILLTEAGKTAAGVRAPPLPDQVADPAGRDAGGGGRGRLPHRARHQPGDLRLPETARGGRGELTLRTEKMTRRTESRPAAFLLA